MSINHYQINNRLKDSPLVQLCNKYKFEVFPTPEYDHIVECRCPSGYSHRLTMKMKRIKSKPINAIITIGLNKLYSRLKIIMFEESEIIDPGIVLDPQIIRKSYQ